MQKRRNRRFGFSSFALCCFLPQWRLLAGQVKVGDAVVKGGKADYFIFTSS